MNLNDLPSKVLQKAVEDLSRLPGIGYRTALRLALHILRQDKALARSLAKSIHDLRENIQYCRICHNISDEEICSICSNPNRHRDILCVVQDVRDVIAIERTQEYKGLYHVLGGLISPLDGITPTMLHLSTLFERIQTGEIREIILALPATIEGDNTSFFIYQQLMNVPIQFTTISRGISVGDELDYMDELTLAQSIKQRIPYQFHAKTLNK
ncbi:MAG: recombination mediator RecR [Bacteroidales bacterium]|nr:recombination mediator RecR [Bacteroidales bacterium]